EFGRAVAPLLHGREFGQGYGRDPEIGAPAAGSSYEKVSSITIFIVSRCDGGAFCRRRRSPCAKKRALQFAALLPPQIRSEREHGQRDTGTAQTHRYRAEAGR